MAFLHLGMQIDSGHMVVFFNTPYKYADARHVV
jgi:hypothetical protein